MFIDDDEDDDDLYLSRYLAQRILLRSQLVPVRNPLPARALGSHGSGWLYLQPSSPEVRDMRFWRCSSSRTALFQC